MKSAVLLAGLYADGETTVVEPAPTRDHTERMLAGGGSERHVRPTSVTVRPADRLSLGEVEVPGDFSSAAPFVVAATLVPGSELHVHGVNLNPRRTGLLVILERMGAKRHRLQPAVDRRRAGGDLEIHSAPLVGGRWSARGGAARDRRAAALRARRGLRPGRERASRRRRAPRQGDRPDRGHGGRAPRARGPRPRDRGRLRRDRRPARLRGGRMSSRGDHRLAMLGAVAGPRLARGRADRGRRRRRGQLPGLLRDGRRLRRSTSAVVKDSSDRDDRGDRRPGGLPARAPWRGRSPIGSASAISTRARCTAR